MPRIQWIDDDDADGRVGEIYREWKRRHPGRKRMPDILKCLSLNPELLEHVIGLCYPLHFSDGALSRRQKERIATYVSALNRCPY
jgi:hypothetical protein